MSAQGQSFCIANETWSSPDPERDEALNILADLIQLSNGPKTISTNH